MSRWLITSFGLPVAMTMGRLAILGESLVSLHPFGATAAGSMGVTAALACRAGVRRRHHRALRRASVS